MTCIVFLKHIDLRIASENSLTTRWDEFETIISTCAVCFGEVRTFWSTYAKSEKKIRKQFSPRVENRLIDGKNRNFEGVAISAELEKKLANSPASRLPSAKQRNVWTYP